MNQSLDYLKEEQSSLDKELEELQEFLESDEFRQVNGAEQNRLKRQRNSMYNLNVVLKERIEAFEESDDEE